MSSLAQGRRPVRTPVLLPLLLAETIGTALLLAVVVGSGIMAERLSGASVALALLANTGATVCGLYVLITALGPVSGAQFNPSVTLALWALGRVPGRRVPAYLLAQTVGAVLGVWLAHGMFDLPIWQSGDAARTGPGQWLSEGVATAGLLGTILCVGRYRPDHVAAAVALYIGAAYWFTASTSFANPAVTLARSLTGSFAGIAPADAPGFILAQLAAAGAVVLIARALGNGTQPTHQV